ncbi:hypothetical protein FCH28_24795 [Streptomyces piniterrae]|uniref:Pyrrolo-quinoline quinone repeat domain-containing protein n=1 Tax=Streptomyces piniterrae TaxID=2571125 RepID=A0A4U0N6W4_9ACTN|nr:PQQ-binding-like beta-propeller repeat protein [Streptomyces piniterrae]TJZ49521.1 hypothetical protein FCH28_24795 [Streptomyces piniterrae]
MGTHRRIGTGIDRRQMLKLGAGAAGALASVAVWRAVNQALEEDKPPAHRPRWTFLLEDEGDPGTDLAPVVHDHGTVYLATQDGPGLYAFDATTGRKRWHTPLPGTYSSDLTVSAGTVSSGTVYLTTDDGTVHALRTSDGEHRWTARPSGPRDDIAGFSAPMSAGSLVLLSILPSTYDEDPDPPPSVLYALDATYGHLVWDRDATLLDVRDGLAYISLPDGGIGALDPQTQELRWSAPPGKKPAHRTVDVFGKDTLYGRNGDIGIGSELVAYDPRTGAVRWTSPAEHASSAVLQGDTVYINAPGHGKNAQQRLHALNAATGAVRWTAPAFSTVSYESPVIAADADSVYLIWSEDLNLDESLTTVQAYDARTGRPRWRAERPESSYCAVTAPGHHLIVGYLDDWYGYDARSGRARWRVGSGEDGSAGTPPLVADGMAFCGNEEGVRAIRLTRRPEER